VQRLQQEQLAAAPTQFSMRVERDYLFLEFSPALR
jgi:hypothetical protein